MNWIFKMVQSIDFHTIKFSLGTSIVGQLQGFKIPRIILTPNSIGLSKKSTLSFRAQQKHQLLDMQRISVVLKMTQGIKPKFLVSLIRFLSILALVQLLQIRP